MEKEKISQVLFTTRYSLVPRSAHGRPVLMECTLFLAPERAFHQCLPVRKYNISISNSFLTPVDQSFPAIWNLPAATVSCSTLWSPQTPNIQLVRRIRYNEPRRLMVQLCSKRVMSVCPASCPWCHSLPSPLPRLSREER